MKKILLSLTVVCLLFACSDSGSSNNSAGGIDPALESQINDLIKNNLDSKELVFNSCNERQELTNPRNVSVDVLSLDIKFISIAEKQGYTSVITENYGSSLGASSTGSVYMTIDDNLRGNIPTAKLNPYTFIAFLTPDEKQKYDDAVKELDALKLPTAAEYDNALITKILEIAKPYIKVYKVRKNGNFSCSNSNSDSGSSNNPSTDINSPDIATLKEEIDNLIKNNLEKEELVFNKCSEYFTIQNPKGEKVKMFFLDLNLIHTEIFDKDGYTSIIDGYNYPNFGPNESKSVSMFIDDNSIHKPTTKFNPYTIFTFLTDSEHAQYIRALTNTTDRRPVVAKMIEIAKPTGIKVYKVRKNGDFSCSHPNQ